MHNLFRRPSKTKMWGQGWGILLSGCFLKTSPLTSEISRAFSLFAPFNLLVPSVLICERSEQISRGLFSETEKKLQCQKNQKVTKICQKKSTYAPSADPWFVLYKLAKPFFFTAFQVELAAM